MPALDNLPADQRAVLELVLQRGRSYEEIAQMLAIDRAGVRQRALAALDALGPQTRVEPLRRALITDYLLGQLPPRISDETREKLARSPSERAWARVLASELAPLARDRLPQIPVHDASASEPSPEASGGGRAGASRGRRASVTRAGRAAASGSSRAATAEPEEAEDGKAKNGKATDGQPEDEQPEGDGAPVRRTSRLGGAVLLGLALVAVVVVVVLLATGGSSKKNSSHPAASSRQSSSSASSSVASRVIAQVNLLPPGGNGPAKGIAQVIAAGTSSGIAIYATGVPANNHNAYAVWLYNSPTSTKLLGFVSPGVSSNGQLQTQGPLPADAGTYKQLLVTLETQQHPTTPGQVVLQGALNLP